MPITSTQFKRKYYLRNLTASTLLNVPRRDLQDVKLHKDMLIISNNLPPQLLNDKIVGLVTQDLINPKALYTKINLRNITMTKLREEETGLKYVNTVQEFLRQPSTRILYLDTIGLMNAHKPKIRAGNAIQANYDYLNTVFSSAVEPYNTSIRIPCILFEVPETLPNTIEEIQRLLKQSDKQVEKKVTDKRFIPFLYLIKHLTLSKFENEFLVRDDITLMFYTDNNVVVLNLHDLVQVSPIYDDFKGVSKITERKLIQTILKYILDLNELETEDVEATLKTFESVKEITTSKPPITIDETVIKQAKEKTKDTNIEYLYKTMNLVIPAKQIVDTRKQIIDLKPDTMLDIQKDKLPTGSRGSVKDTSNGGDTFNKQQAKDYHKHIERAIVALNASGYKTEILETKDTKNIAEDYKMYTISIKPLSGPAIKQKLIVPNIDETSAIKRSGNRYVIRKQKHDTVIRKIKKDRVVLSSHYSKLFINRGEQASASQPAKIKRYIMSKYQNAVPGDFLVYNTKLPYTYEQIGSSIRSFMKDDILFTFNYQQRLTPQISAILKKRKKTLKDVELNRVVIGSFKDTLYYTDFNNNIIKDDGKTVETISTLKEYLELPDLTPQYITTKVAGARLPLVAILMRYYTLEELFVLMDVRPREIQKQSELKDEWMLKFQDKILAFPNSNVKAMILLSGLTFFKNINNLPYTAYKDVKIINEILSDAGVSMRTQRELINLYNLFVDPLSFDVLTELNQPTTFQGILLYVVDLLKDDYITDVNTIEGFVLKGSNRISGLIYNILSRQIAANVHNMNQRRHTLTVSPYELLKELSADPTLMPEDDINPISYDKNRENVTILGKFARTKDTVDMKAREFHPTAVGLESEATKESGNTGMDFYQPASPQLTSLTGVMKPIKESQIDYSNIYSPSAMMAPFVETEDGKRSLFISVQNAHVIPSSQTRVLPILTGFEYIYPYRVGEKYALHAKETGKVTKVTTNSITIKYKKDSETYHFKDWYGKEAGGKTYPHRMVTNLVVNDTVKTDDCIYFDKGFFGTDIFNRKRVVYKTGSLVYTLLNESPETFEDSCSMSESFANNHVIEKTYVRDVVLELTDDISETSKVGDKLVYNDLLIQLGHAGGDGLSSNAKEVLASIEASSPRAKHIGELEHIEIYYNDTTRDGVKLPISSSIEKFIKKHDSEMVKNKGHKGRVDNTFSYNGRPLQDGQILIKYFIVKSQHHYIGSKLILSNQLKATPASTFSDKTKTLDGTPIDIQFSMLSVNARIVPSFNQLISLSTVVKFLSDEIISIWDE